MTATRTRSLGFLLTVFAAAIAALAFAGSALAETDEGTGTSSAPSISSDKVDYAPGELVTLTGTNWAAGEAVVVNVNDDEGESWYRSVTVTADSEGRITDQFNLPNWFVATYAVSATGPSGTATTSFTDSNPQAIIVDSPTNVTVTQGATAAYGAQTLEVGGNTNPCTTTFSVVAGGGTGLPAGATPQWGTNPVITTGDDVTTSFSVNTTSTTPTGTYTFRIHGANGPECQGPGPTDSNLLTLVVTAANTAPVAQAQSVSTDEDTAKTVTLSGSDADGDTLTFAIVSTPSHGALGGIGTVSCTGTAPKTCTADVTYTPNANYNGPDSFTFKVNDGMADSAPATVSITVDAVDDAPIAVNDSQTVAEDSGATTIDVLDNDVDIDGGPMVVESVTQPANGTVAITNGGADLTYQPDADYCNDGDPTDDFTYTLNGGSTATVAVTVTCVDDAPVAVDDAATVAEDASATTIDVLANDMDVDGGQMVVESVTQPANGTVVITNDGADLTYQPDADYCNGGDPTDNFSYTLNGGDAATVAVTVTCVNDAPVAADDSYSTDEDTPLSEAAPGVLGNDSDVDGDSLTAVLVDDVSNGTLTLNADGSFDYTPDPDFNGTDSFTYTANDGALDSNTATVTLTVNPVNDAPTVAADNASVTVDEGSTAANTGTFDDADLDDSSPDTVTITASVGTVTQDDSARTWSWSFGTSDGPDDSQTVTITATDDAGETAQTTFDLMVRNVHPTVDLVGPASADEGETESYSYTFTDPGADSWTHAVSCGGSGSVSDDEFDEGAKSGSFKCTWDDNHASQIVSAKVDDDDGGTDTDTIDVEIANVAPTATFNNGPVDEGDSFTLSLTDPSDPSAADTAAGFEYRFDCGDGNGYGDWGTSNSRVCPTDDNGTRNVKGEIRDKDGGASEYTDTVTVNNVAPTVTVDGPSPVNESTSAEREYTITTSDPGADTFTLEATSCGTGGTFVTGSSTFDTDTGAGSFKCLFEDGPASPTVSATVKDDDGGEGTGNKPVTVDNVAPTVTLTGDDSADEAQTKTYSFTTSDPGEETFALVGDPSCGSSGSYVINTATIDPDTGAGSFQCAFPDDNPSGTASDSTTVSVTVSDGDGGEGTGTKAVTVSNVEPTITSVTGPADPVQLGNTATVVATYSDPGTQDTHTCTFAWGDGSPDTTAPGAAGTCQASHTYSAPGVYRVTVTVTDDDGGSDTDTYEFVVVFDPNGGFVTGGGWINSPAGAYPANPTLTGKANFGFVSKYQKGAKVPSGQTEFQFHAAGFNFHSSAYEWLVVSGCRAQYKGSGKVNGSGDYGFLLTSRDGNACAAKTSDTFRIKIWDRTTNAVVYDNQPAAADDADATMEIASGNIVIHDGKK